MKIAIIGVGAIGALWAYKLQQAGHQVLTMTRDKSPTQLQIQLDDNPIQTFSANALSQLTTCDVILITVKSTQVNQAIAPLYSFITAQTPLIFLHNGMGALDTLGKQWQQHCLYLATTTQAAFKPSPQQVKHTGHGLTLIGRYQAHQPALSQHLLSQLNLALPSVIWDDNIQAALWKKLAVNCVINPSTAYYHCKNGALTQEQYHAQLHALIQECHQVMQLAGPAFPLDELQQYIYQVIEATADNYSSMYQDIQHQRPTEIDFITGFLLKKAKQYDLHLPTHSALYQQIKKLENDYS